MIKQAIKLLLIAILSFGMDKQLVAADMKEIAQVVWYAAEVGAGWQIGQRFSWKSSKEERFTFGVATISLFVHGLRGLNKKLKIIQRVENLLK